MGVSQKISTDLLTQEYALVYIDIYGSNGAMFRYLNLSSIGHV